MFPLVQSTTPASKMMFRARNMGKKDWRTNKVRSPFPFKAMKVNQSFFMILDQVTGPEKIRLVRDVREYSKTYAVQFRIIKRLDQWEVARIY